MATQGSNNGNGKGQHLLVHVSGNYSTTTFSDPVEAIMFKAFMSLDGEQTIITTSEVCAEPWEFGDFWARAFHGRVAI